MSFRVNVGYIGLLPDPYPDSHNRRDISELTAVAQFFRSEDVGSMHDLALAIMQQMASMAASALPLCATKHADESLSDLRIVLETGLLA